MADSKVLVKFKQGTLANLPAAKDPGTFHITTDERAIYLDVDSSTRIRLGDFQEFATLAALNSNGNPNTTALYYVTDINCLAKWDGSKYVQINPDTGATNVTVTGSGNAVTGASYDPSTRTITLTKGATYMTSGDVDNKITALNLADTYYSKSLGEANANAITNIKDGKDIDSFGDVETALAGKQDTIPANTYDAYGAASNVLGKASDTSASETVKGARLLAAEKVASVAGGDDSVTIGGTATAPTVAVKIDGTAGNSLSLVSGKGLRVEVPAADTYSIIQDENSGNYSAVYHLTKNGNNVGVAINIPKDMVVQSGSVVTNPSGKDPGTYLKLVLANATNDEIFIDVGSLIEYVTSGSKTGDMVVVSVSNDHKVTATITDGTVTLAKLESSVQTKINQAHTHANSAELDLIASGDKNKWDTAASTASANSAAITNIKDGTNIDSFGDVETALSGKQDTIPANTYDAYGAASGVKTELIGASGNAKTADTIYGAKAYADAAVAEALAWDNF